MIFENAKANAKLDCPKCHGTGQWRYDDTHYTVCNLCCKHNMGYWQLKRGYYGKNDGKWCCMAGCGQILEDVPDEQRRYPESSRQTDH